MRDPDLHNFLEAAKKAYGRYAGEGRTRASLDTIFQRLETPVPARAGPGSRLPVCGCLDDVFSADFEAPDLSTLIAAFRTIEPRLRWYRRATWNETASANFPDGHANTMIFGPQGLEEHSGLMLGVSLLGPQVRYPDHDHAPEETYLVMTEGEFRHGESDWFTPGVGGSFYNSPGIGHAMRSGDKPLFAFWALLSV